MRPVLVEINRAVAPRLETARTALPLRIRLLAALPMINIITGLVVAALTGDRGESLGVAVLVAIGVATTLSLELTVLLSRSILSPLRDLQLATERVAAGDYSAAVPVTTADEIGELASSFNQMVTGLRERERLREAFGTYLDREVAEYILSEGFDEHGVEAEVTIMFCDVRDFTSFAAGAEAREVVARLNALFEVVVPLIGAEGGHVDKFEGDGLMAVFGAPEPYPDHAERAVRAALEIDARVNVAGEGGGFRLGVGLNTGRVIAGSVGGGGRLNFSVIGDAVNVASRVQAETRNTGAAVLMAAATAAELGPGFVVSSHGMHELKGLDRPVELLAPQSAPVSPASGDGTARRAQRVGSGHGYRGEAAVRRNRQRGGIARRQARRQGARREGRLAPVHALGRSPVQPLRRLQGGGHRGHRRPPRAGGGVRGRGLGEGDADARRLRADRRPRRHQRRQRDGRRQLQRLAAGRPRRPRSRDDLGHRVACRRSTTCRSSRR